MSIGSAAGTTVISRRRRHGSTESIPSDFEDLFERPSYGVLVTLLPNGIPHQTVVWVDYDGEHVRTNTACGRRKVANVQQDPRIALCVIDLDIPYRYLSLHGEVTAVTEEGAMDHINALGRRYQNVENWSDRYDDDVTRVILGIEPRGVFTREPYGIERKE